jgi:hypothetical protein
MRPKEKSKNVNPRRTKNAMAKRKKGQTITYKVIQSKLKTDQHETH